MQLVYRRDGNNFTKSATDQNTGPDNGTSPGPTTLTSGLFRVPVEPNLMFNIYTINPHPTAVTTRLVVNKVVGAGAAARKEAILDRELTVPANESFRLSMEASAGDAIEVNSIQQAAGTPLRFVTPSATVVQYFPADGGLTPQVTAAAGSFVAASARFNEAPQILPTAPTGRVTTGLIDIPQGVAAARPQVQLMLSSFADWPLTATITVSELVEHVATPQPIAQRTIQVGARGAAVVPFTSVEGRTVKFDVNLPSGLVASLDVFTLFLADNSTMPVFRLGPGEWAVV